MIETRTSRIKRKIKHRTPEIIVAVSTVAGIAALFYIKHSLKSNELQTEPDRLAGPSMIVLENVQSNLWHDMDEPDNHYWLNPA